MKDLSKFNLDYVRKEDGKLFKAKRLIDGDYKIIEDNNPEAEEETISRKKLRNRFNFVRKHPPEKVA